jgi:hypothetical protein
MIQDSLIPIDQTTAIHTAIIVSITARTAELPTRSITPATIMFIRPETETTAATDLVLAQLVHLAAVAAVDPEADLAAVLAAAEAAAAEAAAAEAAVAATVAAKAALETATATLVIQATEAETIMVPARALETTAPTMAKAAALVTAAAVRAMAATLRNPSSQLKENGASALTGTSVPVSFSGINS